MASASSGSSAVGCSSADSGVPPCTSASGYVFEEDKVFDSDAKKAIENVFCDWRRVVLCLDSIRGIKALAGINWFMVS
ncbi:hypothetical protein Celaphus_00002035 [Cervus elaphus hippelaphus]|uniref:Uncharacterized protein n=1 Tax=Cervus elaphus hippelaphus TaxID=46360 RepID=A0A212CGU3_CEREH|nr:hypothetical protein Celaphus_00002035 [Cervus elaphus hippelaphus]